MKKLIFILNALILISCNQTYNKETSIKGEEFESGKDSQIDSVTASQSSWTYDTVTVEMTNAIRKTALVLSTNTEEFKFPYEGGTKAGILIIDENKKKGAVVFVNKGQFTSSKNEMMVRFNNGKPEVFETYQTTPGDPTMMTIVDANEFIKKISQSDSTKIESSFYADGQVVFKFQTSDFDVSLVN